MSAISSRNEVNSDFWRIFIWPYMDNFQPNVICDLEWYFKALVKEGVTIGRLSIMMAVVDSVTPDDGFFGNLNIEEDFYVSPSDESINWNYKNNTLETFLKRAIDYYSWISDIAFKLISPRACFVQVINNLEAEGLLRAILQSDLFYRASMLCWPSDDEWSDLFYFISYATSCENNCIDCIELLNEMSFSEAFQFIQKV